MEDIRVRKKLIIISKDINMDEITYDEFAKVDLRVAKIDHVEKIPGKTRIIKGTISPEQLLGKTVIVVANLETKKLAGIESNAMLLAADVENKPYWLTVDEIVPSGTNIK